MTQYEAIGRRHSVRRFQMTAIDPRIMKQINCFIQTLAPLHPQAAYRIAVVEAYNTQKHVFKGMFLVQAPYYLVLSAKPHPFAAVNAGYVMEQMVLYLVSKGFATCYLGDAKQKPDLDQYQPMIVVAFGKAAVSTAKKTAARKKLTELVCQPPVASQNARKIIEAARIAPSALNLQPWRFLPEDGKIHIFMKKDGFVQTKRMKELTQLDMGIAMCHMALAAEELWLDWQLSMEEPGNEPVWKGCKYMATLYYETKTF